MAIDYKTIGERIQELRKEKNIKQADLAEMLEVSTGYISQIETARSKLSLDFLVKISEILEKDPGYIINGTSMNSADYKLMELGNEMSELNGKERQFVYDFIKLLKKQNNIKEQGEKIIVY